MQGTRRTSKAIPAVLLVGMAIAVSSWAFAQEGGLSGSVRNFFSNQGIPGVIVTVKDVRTGALAGTGITDVRGDYAVSIPSPGNYTVQASRLGYDNMTAREVIALSDVTPNRTVNISMAGNAWSSEKSEKTAPDVSWGTGAHKSYLVPAFEIPAFILLLNGWHIQPEAEDSSFGIRLNRSW